MPTLFCMFSKLIVFRTSLCLVLQSVERGNITFRLGLLTKNP